MKRLFTSPRAKAVKEEVSKILHLPFVERVFHRSSRRPFAVVSAGIGIMVSGSFIAHNAAMISEMLPVHEILADTFGYFLHGIGAVPALRYVEPVWAILLGAEEAAV